MPTNLTGLSYPFDPTGTLASNRITGELQTITAMNGHDFQFIVPRWAPFYEDTATVIYRDPVTGVSRPLVKNVDWYASHYFLQASRACAKPIYGSISILNNKLVGVLTISYQTVGGSWTLDLIKIQEILADRLHNPRITTWEEVVGYPIKFPVIDHEWDLIDMVGAKDLVTALQAIENQIRLAGTSGLQEHIDNHDNPHQVTKAQTGLGNVVNLPLATPDIAIQGISNNHYMTPYLTRSALVAGPSADLNAHIALRNPHGTQASDVNAYSKNETQTLLNSYLLKTAVAADTFRFDGKTPIQYKAWVLEGVAADAYKAYGMTLNELKLTVQGGPAANTDRFDNKTYPEAKADILSGTAANATEFDGKTYTEAKNDILLGTAANASKLENRTFAEVVTAAQANSQKFAGKTYDEAKADILTGTAADSLRLQGATVNDILTQIDSATASQYSGTSVTGQPDATVWAKVATFTIPAGPADYAASADLQWLVSGGEAPNQIDSSLYYLRFSRRGTVKGLLRNLGGVDNGVRFGYVLADISVDPGVVEMGYKVYAKVNSNHTTLTITELNGVGGIETVFEQEANEPAGIVYVADVGLGFVTQSDLTATNTNVAQNTNDISTINTTLTAINQQLATQTAAIGDLTARVTALEHP